MVVLIADDDPDDRLLIRDAFGEIPFSVNLHFVENGQELLDYLHHLNGYADSNETPNPDLILLDLNMPGKDGRQALREIKSNPDVRNIPVVIFTTSKEQEEIEECYKLGANSFVTKPLTFDGLVQAVKILGLYWFEIVRLPTEREAY